MDKKKTDNDIFQEIYLLYELSLAVGQSLEVIQNCKHFINVLHSKKNLDFAAVWIKDEFLPNNNNITDASLIYAIPGLRAESKTLSITHPSFSAIIDNQVVVIHESDDYFFDIVTERKITKGVYGIFTLNDIGYLKIYSSNADAFDLQKLRKLLPIIKKFANSIEGAIAHQDSIESEKKIAKIINSALDAVIIVDERGSVTDWNSQAEQIFGWSKEEVIHKEMGQFIIPHQYHAAHCVGMTNYFKTGEGPVLNKRIEITATGKNRDEFPVELTVIPIELATTTIFSAFVRDITEQKEAKKALIDAREKAEASAKAKDRFLANMSHEFRTPLNAIYGMGELLDKTDLSPKQNQYLNVLKVSAENLIVIVNDILDVAKIDADKITTEKVGFKLRTLLFNIFQTQKNKAESKDIDLQWDLDPNISPILVGDPVRLNQILLNLTNNAIKFTEQGYVKIGAELCDDDSDKQCIKFFVKDTGIGIEEDKKELIFESFTQEDESITRRFGGTGLGLSISKKLVEIFGGNLTVESKKKSGSIFHFSLNLAKGTEEHLPHTEDIAEVVRDIKGLQILLVEDHEFNQFWVTQILEEYGLFVEVANDGVEGVEKVKEKEYDLILMDMHMPRMDGLEATEIIRKELKSTVPIVALTANAIAKDRDRCMEAGMNDYLSKPFESIKLLQIMHRLIVAKDRPRVQRDQPLFDLTKLGKQTNNNEEFMKKMVGMFVDRMPTSITEIEQHHDQKEWERVYAIAHKIKPSIDILDIAPLKPIIRAIEESAKQEKDIDQLPKHIESLKNIGTEVVKQLKEKFAL